ncbi:MAG: orotate phosphoribosyltransferase [Bradyrhizobiaceae bacterium]|nr:orotate phosphoribosyltransferase [Bradyrhizobiaceae bacterium]
MLRAVNANAPAARHGGKPAAGLEEKKARLLRLIREKSFLTEGGPFRLASGGTSDYYLDMKPSTFSPEGLSLIADIVYAMLREDHSVEAVGGLELGALPITSAVSMRSFGERPIEGFVVRKEKKDHGTAKKIDGNFRDNSTVVLFEDVTTQGGSVMEAVRAVRARGAKVTRIITIVDRLEGAAANLEKEGIALEAVFTIEDLRR